MEDDLPAQWTVQTSIQGQIGTTLGGRDCQAGGRTRHVVLLHRVGRRRQRGDFRRTYRKETSLSHVFWPDLPPPTYLRLYAEQVRDLSHLLSVFGVSNNAVMKYGNNTSSEISSLH
jgi:hypothetical protein